MVSCGHKVFHESLVTLNISETISAFTLLLDALTQWRPALRTRLPLQIVNAVISLLWPTKCHAVISLSKIPLCTFTPLERTVEVRLNLTKISSLCRLHKTGIERKNPSDPTSQKMVLVQCPDPRPLLRRHTGFPRKMKTRVDK